MFAFLSSEIKSFYSAPLYVCLALAGICQTAGRGIIPLLSLAVCVASSYYANTQFSPSGSNKGDVPQSGLSMWLRSDVGIATSNGGVSVWTDQSGNGANAIQENSTKQPAFVANCAGAPCVRFDGFSSFLHFDARTSGFSGMTILVVTAANINVDPNSTSSVIYWPSSDNLGGTYVAPFQQTVGYSFGDGETDNKTQYSRSRSIKNRVTVTTVIKDGPAESLYVDGVLALASTDHQPSLTEVADQAYLGMGKGNIPFAGDVYEVLVYDRALSPSEQTLVEQYLINEYETTPREAAINVKTLPRETAINVKTFGVNGEGEADDTVAIQSAFNSAPVNDGVVYFPNGTYHYSSLQISGKTNLTVHGDDAVLVKTGSQLTGVQVTASPGLTVSNLTFDYNFQNGSLFDITSPNATFISNIFKNVGDGSSTGPVTGLYVAPGSDNLFLQGNIFFNFRSGPSGAVRGVYLANYRNTAAATIGARIIGNQFDTLIPSYNADAIVIDQQGFSSHALIANNLFYNSSKRAIKLMSNDNTVSGNSIIEDNLGTPSYSAVSSYGDGNVIADNTSIAKGCDSGCSFYAAWELSGNNITLANNIAQNPSTTTDKDIDCISVKLPTGYSSLNNLVITGNTCNTFRYARFYSDTPTNNLVFTNNTFLNARGGAAVLFYPGAGVDGLNFSGNVTDGTALLASFASPGTSNKSNFNIGSNTGLIDLNLANDPVPGSSFTVNTSLVPQGSIRVYHIEAGQKFATGSTPPGSGYWNVGDVVYNSASQNGTEGWTCIAAGAPGAWAQFSN